MAASGELRTRERALTCRVGRKVCALPLEQVLETMRPLPVEPLAELPPFVRGLAVIRGRATPVVDARTLLGSDDEAPAGRYVTLRCGQADANRVAALAVDAVLDVVMLDASALAELPQLLGAASSELVSALGSLNQDLLLVLKHGRIVPDELWQRLERRETRA